MITLSEASEKFFTYLSSERHLSDRTVDTYRTGLRVFGTFLSDSLNITEIEKISTAHIRLFIVEMNRQGKKPSSVDTWLSSVKSLYRFLTFKQIVTDDPSLAVSRLKIPDRLPSFFKDDQMSFLLDQTSTEGTVKNEQEDLFLSKRDRAMLELLYSSGLRVSELVGLDLNRVFLDDLTVKVLGKGRKERIVPMGEVAAAAIEEYLKLRELYAATDENALFINVQGRRTTARNVAMRLRVYAETHGFSGRIHPHKMRHSFATVMVSNSKDVRAVQEMLGHEKLSTTQIYTHSDITSLCRIYRTAHPRDAMSKRNSPVSELEQP